VFDNWNWSDTLKLSHIAILLAILVFNVFLYQRTRSTKMAEDLKKALVEGDADLRDLVDGYATRVGESLRDHGHRIAILETTIRHMPTHGDLLGIRGELNSLNGTVSALNERSETTHEMVRSIQQHLLESK